MPYVPESRLLAAEARVREVEAERDAALELVNNCGPHMREMQGTITTLRAERDALVPLARLGLELLDDNLENYGGTPLRDLAVSFGVLVRFTNDGPPMSHSWQDDPTTTQARAILDREET